MIDTAVTEVVTRIIEHVAALATDQFLRAFAERDQKEVWRGILEATKIPPEFLTPGERERFMRLLDRPRFRELILSQLQRSDKRGAILIGPSGVGKTSIYEYLHSRALTLRSPVSTSSVTVKFNTSGGMFSAIRDTPGDVNQPGGLLVAENVASLKPYILILSVAAGYLETSGAPRFKRPGVASHSDIHEYLDNCADEEIVWVEKLAKAFRELNGHVVIPYGLIVVNKVDLWYPDMEQVINYYRGTPRAASVSSRAAHLTDARSRRFASAWASLWNEIGLNREAKPKVIPVGAKYSSFYKEIAPEARVQAQEIEFFLALLRAEIRCSLYRLKTMQS